MIIPVSAILATRNRAAILSRTLDSLLARDLLPAELIVVDASGDDLTKKVISEFGSKISSVTSVQLINADVVGAAAQRNQGVAFATQPFVWFFDDDIIFEPECAQRLWRAIESDRQLGGVSAMIVNQCYQPPRFVSRTIFTLMHGKREKTFAGRVIGPGINLLPEDREDLPELVPVEWLNLGCTIYRREALPSPPFDSVFTSYSIMEDLTLSLRVAKKWRLANVRTARIFHDSQPGSHKADVSAMAKMELVNRHYVMTKILGRDRLVDHLRLFLWEAFQMAVSAWRSQSRTSFGETWRGKWRALCVIANRPVTPE